MARVNSEEEKQRINNLIERVLDLKNKEIDDEYIGTYNEFINLLNTNILNVVFTKKNGKIRYMKCNRSGGADMADLENKLVKVYDLEKNGYRSFTVDSIIEINIA